MRRIINIENGVTRHPERRMAEPVSLSIYEGEQLAIVGRNGSGKSRLVDILIGRYPLLQNEVQFDFGETASKLVSDNISYITFRDSYGGDMDGNYYYQQRWNQHELNEENQLLTLSSGEMRRYQLARALESNPRILVIDNPFIGLDSPTRTWLATLLQQLAEERGLTLILILSKMADVPDFITHIIPVEGLRVGQKAKRENVEDKNLSSKRIKSDFLQTLAPKDLSQTPFYPSNGGEILKFSDVTIRYGSRTILSHLDWVVREGERWSVSGRNGAGKSTLLSLVCADNPQAYACNIELFGHRRGSGESIWEIKKHIGYVSPEMHRAYQKDFPAIDIVASGLNDSIGLYTRPRPEERELCLHWMETFGIEDLAQQSFLKMSSGEQRLCLLARAFVKDPELLILDEPMHGLDNENCELTKSIIETFCKRPNKTFIMVTHYKEELPPCIDKHLYLKLNR